MTKETAATPKARKARSTKADAARTKGSKLTNISIRAFRSIAAIAGSLNEEQRNAIFTALDAEQERLFSALQNPPPPPPAEAEFVLPA
jgi:hypothetical protein